MMPAQESSRDLLRRLQGRVGGKEKNHFKDHLQSIVVKGVAIEISPENRIMISA
jgi:hypothetical protein